MYKLLRMLIFPALCICILFFLCVVSTAEEKDNEQPTVKTETVEPITVVSYTALTEFLCFRSKTIIFQVMIERSYHYEYDFIICILYVSSYGRYLLCWRYCCVIWRKGELSYGWDRKSYIHA